MARILLGLGSNLGDRLGHLRAGLAGLERVGIRLLNGSRVYESPPMGPQDQGPFLNAVVAAETTLTPEEVLAAALAVEAEEGRVRIIKWGPRTLDIDLLWYEGEHRASDDLTLPHPGLAERSFVLRPLADVSPALRLPDGRTVTEAVEALEDDGCLPLSGENLDG